MMNKVAIFEHYTIQSDVFTHYTLENGKNAHCLVKDLIMLSYSPFLSLPR